MGNNRLKIGEFSRLCKVTVRTLRHYEKIGLLVPEIIDRYSGYRYYSVGQFQKMQSIMHLKELGYTLEEIGAIWEDESHVPSPESLEEKILACEAELERLKRRHRMLRALTASRKRIKKMNKITIESLPAITVASYRAIIPSYEDLGRICCEVIAPEMARLGCECPEPGYCYTVEHGGYKPQNIDIEYCEQVTAFGAGIGNMTVDKTASKGVNNSRPGSVAVSDIIKFKEIPEVPTAVCMKVYGSYDKLYRNYVDLFAWIEKEGYRIVGDPRANYIDGIWNQEDPDKWLTIIQVPVER